MPSTITVDYNAATAIPSSAPTRTNFTFKGWNTAANGSGTSYTAGQSIAHLTTNLPLYAQWEAYPVVTYNANSGALPSDFTASDTVAPGVYNIKTGTPTRTGYVFGGWTPTQNSTANGLYSYNATISGSQRSMNVTSPVTLYALWNPVVTYSTGTLPAGAKDTIANMPSTTTYTVNYNGTHTVLTTPTPTLTGYTFGGWAKSTAATTKVTSITNVTAPVTLIPIWTEKSGYTIQFFDQATATTDGARLPIRRTTSSGQARSPFLLLPPRLVTPSAVGICRRTTRAAAPVRSLPALRASSQQAWAPSTAFGLLKLLETAQTP